MKICFADHEETIRSLEKELREEIAKSADARGALAKTEVLEGQVAGLKLEVVRLTDENSKLTDRVMIANGHHPIYQQPKKADGGEPVSPVLRATEFCKQQEESEEELGKQERLEEGRRALARVMEELETTQKGATNAAN